MKRYILIILLVLSGNVSAEKNKEQCRLYEQLHTVYSTLPTDTHGVSDNEKDWYKLILYRNLVEMKKHMVTGLSDTCKYTHKKQVDLFHTKKKYQDEIDRINNILRRI